MKISPDMVARRLGEQGYHRWVVRKVPYLTEGHKIARRAYVKQYRVWNREEFSSVVFPMSAMFTWITVIAVFMLHDAMMRNGMRIV